MTVHIVRLGSPRTPSEGPRIGTVRRPPRGVPKSEFASGNWYDVWYPNLAPSEALLKAGQAATGGGDAQAWKLFERRFRAEMKQPDAARSLDLLATLSLGADFALGCYCADESRCHRSILRALLAERGAKIV